MRSLLLIAAGCSLNVDYKGTTYQCAAGDTCPDGYTCVDQVCVPSQPPAPSCSTALGAGGDHSCAVRSDGSVWCWGANESGQLGDGTVTDSDIPVQVVNVSGAKQVTTGNGFSCALDSAGAVWCWGKNDNGQLGIGNTLLDSPVPLEVLGQP